MNKIKSNILIVLALIGLFAGINTAFARTPDVTCNSATVYGNVWPNNTSVSAWFEWGNDRTTVQNGSGTRVGYQQLNYDKEISASLSGLNQNTAYYYRLAVQSGSDYVPATTETFTTSTCSVVNPPINGGWSDWSAKDNSCGVSGTQARSCTNPSPANGGAYCSGASTQSYTNAACSVPAPTVTLTANPTSVAYNGSSAINWSSTNATYCTLSGDWSGTQGTSGSFSTGSLTSSKTYIITCTGNGGNATKSVTVSVGNQPVSNPTVTLTANPTSVAYGGTSYLTWTSTNATSCSASGGNSGWAGSKNLSGSFYTGTLNSTTTYNITCSNSSGSANDSVTVSVENQPVSNPTVSLTASNLNVTYGGATYLSWTSTNATSCSASSGTNGWAGSKSTAGSFYTGALTNSTTYNINCTNSSGSANDSVTVNVGNQPISNPTVSLTANPTSVAYGGTSYLSWTSTNATSCSASGGNSGWAGSKNLSGSFYTGTLNNTTTYNITCSNGSGSANDSVTVSVGTQSLMSGTLTLPISSCVIPSGSNSCDIALAWTTTNPQVSPSSITSPYPYSGYVVATGNNSSYLSVPLLYVSSPRSFYLYNNNILLAQATATANCALNTSWDSNSNKCAPTPVNNPTVSLTANPTSVAYGGTSYLSWTSTNATSCSASGGNSGWAGSKNLSGSFYTGTLNNTTTYNITCSNGSGSANDSVTVSVGNQLVTQTPTVSLIANPSSVQYGGSSILTWTSINTTSCSASWTTSNITSGTKAVYPTATTTYSITCTGTGGSVSDSTIVSVGTQILTPTVSLTANPTSVAYGGTSYLTWISTNATSCNGSGGNNGWAGSKNTTGSFFYTGALTNTTTFSITCSNGSGSANDLATVNVQTATCQDSSALNYGGIIPCTYYQAPLVCQDPSALNYRGTLPCSYYQAPLICQDPSATNYRGTLPCNYYTYIQTCQDPSALNYRGTLPCSYPVQIQICQDPNATNYRGILPCTYNTFVNNQPTVGISADQTSIPFNGTTSIRWYTTNATSCYASDGSIGWAGTKSIGPGSFYTGSLTSGKTYNITCNNNYGSATDSVIVAVRPQTITTATATVRPAPTSLVLITSSVDRNQPIVPTIDNTRPKPGDEINYTVNYQNIGTGAITSLTLRMDLPYEVDYMSSTPNNPTISGNTLIFNLGTLKANGQGTATVRVRVRDNIPAGTNLNFPATLSYVDPSGQPQSVSANVSAQVWSEPVTSVPSVENTVPLGALAFLFGGSFLPNTLLGWLLLILVITLLVLAGRKAYYGYRSNTNTTTVSKKTVTNNS